jgi:cytochrome c-type biogenesis protein CcmH/NrfG
MAYDREIETLWRRWKEKPGGTDFAPLAELCRKDGRMETALEVLRIGLRQHPGYLPGQMVQGRCFRDLGRHAEAEPAFRHAIEIEPGNELATQELADLKQRTAAG